MRGILFLIFLSLGACVFAQADSLRGEFSKPLAKDSMEKREAPGSGSPSLTDQIKDELPQVVTENDKKKLKLSFPWRDDIFIPLPKALFPAPWTESPDPTVAWQRSLMFPGLGQVYNRSGWKVPIFYTGYAAIGGWLAFTNSQYSLYRRAFFCFENGCERPEGVVGDGQGLRRQRETWRQRRDQAILILIAWHGIGAVEAYVDAHLKDFDVSEDLSLKLGPTWIEGPIPGPGIGLSFTFHSKKSHNIHAIKASPDWIRANGKGR